MEKRKISRVHKGVHWGIESAFIFGCNGRAQETSTRHSILVFTMFEDDAILVDENGIGGWERARMEWVTDYEQRELNKGGGHFFLDFVY